MPSYARMYSINPLGLLSFITDKLFFIFKMYVWFVYTVHKSVKNILSFITLILDFLIFLPVFLWNGLEQLKKHLGLHIRGIKSLGPLSSHHPSNFVSMASQLWLVNKNLFSWPIERREESMLTNWLADHYM